MGAMKPEAVVVVAESLLSLYPILLKLSPLPLGTHILSRFGTYSVGSAAFAEAGDWAQTWGSPSAAAVSVISGLMNLVHVGASYASYRHLQAGNALALFYLYPFFNLIVGTVFLGESLSWIFLPLFVLAFVGVVLIGQSETEAEQEDTKKNTTFGVLMALLAAFTETMIFLIVKTSTRKNPFVNMLQLYPAAFLGLLGYEAWNGFPNFIGSLPTVSIMILFNVLVGFIGHVLQFYSIPKLTTAVFSLLAFIGVGAGYGWGVLFAKESLNWKSLLGAGLITGSVGFMRFIS